jgi:excisionase family DNA binding protein
MATTLEEIKFLTTSQAAARLGVSRRRVSLFIKTGRLKATPLGLAQRSSGFQPSAWIISEEDLREFASRPRPVGGAGTKALAS